jgi:hypothetical protein
MLRICVALGLALLLLGMTEYVPPRKKALAADPLKPKRFDKPVWHPDARWQLDPQPYAFDTNIRAHLDGPRHEAFAVHAIFPDLHAGFTGGGRYAFLTYDSTLDRFHAATSGATGYLDGPFSRARFYIDDYHTCRHERASSPDKRFYYLLADFYRQRIRVLDFQRQWVHTLPVSGVAFACGESGKVYVVHRSDKDGGRADTITILSPGPEWKTLRTVRLHPSEQEVQISGLGTSVAVDEKNERLYATTYRAWPWYVWYWDLKDGSLHGVLPNCSKKPNARRSGEAGPFEGTVLYNHGEISWGPDDPDKRFLYLTRVDDNNFYRLDLQWQIIAVFSVKQGRFVEQGQGDGSPLYMYPPAWLPDGSFVGYVPWYNPAPHYKLFRRIQ